MLTNAEQFKIDLLKQSREPMSAFKTFVFFEDIGSCDDNVYLVNERCIVVKEHDLIVHAQVLPVEKNQGNWPNLQVYFEPLTKETFEDANYLNASYARGMETIALESITSQGSVITFSVAVLDVSFKDGEFRFDVCTDPSYIKLEYDVATEQFIGESNAEEFLLSLVNMLTNLGSEYISYHCIPGGDNPIETAVINTKTTFGDIDKFSGVIKMCSRPYRRTESIIHDVVWSLSHMANWP